VEDTARGRLMSPGLGWCERRSVSQDRNHLLLAERRHAF
jgi:hypothetical protein